MSRITLCLAILASCAVGYAQQAGESAPAQGAPERTPLVLHLVVTDKAGHPVTGLQQQDFTLLDNGQPTPITAFTAVGSESSGLHPTIALLVIDEVNTDFRTVMNEHIQLHQFLTANDGHLPVPMSVLILTDTGLRQINQPDQDGNAIDALLTKEKATLRERSQLGGFYGGVDRAATSVGALQSLANAVLNVPARKLVLWLSQGWWTFDRANVRVSDRQHQQVFDTAVQLSSLLRQAQIVLYAINPLGAADTDSSHNAVWRAYMKPVQDARHADPGNLSLQVLAMQSGGRVLFGSNYIGTDISRSLEDASAWYRLSLDPQSPDRPNTWHALEVKVSKPGLNVRTRSGYYARP